MTMEGIRGTDIQDSITHQHMAVGIIVVLQDIIVDLGGMAIGVGIIQAAGGGVAVTTGADRKNQLLTIYRLTTFGQWGIV
jgi:hypothetical protein